MHVLSAAKM